MQAYLGPLSQAIPLWVDAMSIGGGFAHRRGRNGELSVAVGLATRTVGILG